MKRELLTRILEGIWKKYNFHLIWTRKFEFMMINYDDTKWNGRNLYKRPAANSVSSVCPRWTFLALCHIGWGCTARGRHLTIWIMVITQTPKSEKMIFWAAPPALSLRRCPGEHSRRCHTWLLIYITIQYASFFGLLKGKRYYDGYDCWKSKPTKYGIIRKLARWLIIDENNIWGFLWGKLCQWVWSFKKTKWSFTVHCVLPNHQQCQLHSSGTESWEKYICRKQHWSLLSFGWRIFIEVRDTKMHLQKYADVWWRFEQVKKERYINFDQYFIWF